MTTPGLFHDAGSYVGSDPLTGRGVGEAVGDGDGEGVAVGVGEAVGTGEGEAVGVGEAVGTGEGEGPGAGVGDTLGVGTGLPPPSLMMRGVVTSDPDSCGASLMATAAAADPALLRTKLSKPWLSAKKLMPLVL